MQKLHPRFGHVVTPLILTFMMSGLISGLSTIIGIGINKAALTIWPGAWLASWVVAFPAVSVLLPFAQWLTRFVVRAK